MDMLGYLMFQINFSLTGLTVIGSTLISVGLGFLIIHGDGHLFIMGGGYLIAIMDGYGFLVMNGGRDGSFGEDQRDIWDGRQ
ncbi:hypothetical protein D3C85_1154180 [compost metagenome]